MPASFTTVIIPVRHDLVKTGSHYWRNVAYFLDEQGIPFRFINQYSLRAPYRKAFMPSCEPPIVEHKIIPTLAPGQLDRFFAAVEGILYRALFYLMLHTGLMRGKALALKWKHIVLGRSSLGVFPYLLVMHSLNEVDGRASVQKPKTANGKRRVALPLSLALVLRQCREAQEALRTSVRAHS